MTPHEIMSKRIASLGGSPKHVGDIEAGLILSELAAAGYAVVKALPVEDQNIRALEKVGYAVVPVEPTEAMLAAGVNALIVSGLDGEDGVGHAEVKLVWSEMRAVAAKGEA